MTKSYTSKAIAFVFWICLSASSAPSLAEPIVANKTVREAVLIFSAKPDVPDKGFGAIFEGARLYDVNRAHRYEPTKDSAAAKKWQTYLVDESGARLENKLIVTTANDFHQLSLAHSKGSGRMKADFPWSYNVTLLNSILLGNGKKKTLIGSDGLDEAKDIRESHSTNEGIENLEETAETTGHSSKEEETLETDIEFVSIVQDLISIQRDKHAEPFGAVHPEEDRRWETYKLTSNKDKSLLFTPITNSHFQKTLLHQLNAQFDKKVELKSYFPDDDSRWDNFILVPSTGGPDVLFGVPAQAAVVHGTVIKMAGGKFFKDSAVNKTSNNKVISVSSQSHITLPFAKRQKCYLSKVQQQQQ